MRHGWLLPLRRGRRPCRCKSARRAAASGRSARRDGQTRATVRIDVLHNYNYEKSEYFIDNQRVLGIKTAEEYDEYDYKIWKETKKNIEWRKIVLIDKFDIVGTWEEDNDLPVPVRTFQSRLMR